MAPSGIDLADHGAEKIWRQHLWQDVVVRLEEEYPSIPSERSGCCIRLCGRNDDEGLILSAYFATHCLGTMDTAQAGDFFGRLVAAKRERTGTVEGLLFELRSPFGFAGIKLLYQGGRRPELRVVGAFGHCFGVTRGRELDALLDSLSFRLRGGVQ